MAREEGRQDYLLDPMIIPNYGCADIRTRGHRCQGSNLVDIEKYCLRCTNYDRSVSIIKEKKK